MKVARFSRTRPVLTATELFGSVTAGPDGQVLTSIGSNTVSWGSNISDIFINGTTHVLGPYVNFADGSNTTVTVDMVGAVASNTIRIHSTGGGAAFGSNSTNVSETTQVGASSNTARADHYHRGIETITSSSSNTMQRGTWNLRPGAGIALSLTDTDGDGEFDTTTIVNTGSAGGGGGGSITDYVSGASGSGHIIIPGLKASPDIEVAGTNDREFDSSTLGGTALGSPTTIDADTTVRSHLYIKKTAAAGFSLQGRYWSAPSTPFTMTAKITDWTATKATFMRVAVGIAEATPGKTEGMYIDGQSADGSATVSVISSTSPTAGAAYVQAGGVADNIADVPIYFRVVAASSTDVTWYYSHGGLIFRRLATANRNPGFTIGSYFLSAHPEQTTYDIEAAFDWVRFT